VSQTIDSSTAAGHPALSVALIRSQDEHRSTVFIGH